MKFINDNKNNRLDKFVAQCINISRTKAQKLIIDNKVKVNGKITNKISLELQINDEVFIDKEIISNDTNISAWENLKDLSIIFESKDYMIINKPKNLSVHPGAGNQDKTLANILVHYSKSLANDKSIRPGIAHRLDKDTTGLLIVAKNDSFLTHISNQFQNGEVEKKYIGLVEGHMPTKMGLIDAPIGRSEKNRTMMDIGVKNSKESKTEFRVIKRFEKNDLVEFNLLTGRTHQIRIHCKYINAPIFNDPIYGKESIEGIGQFLHSQYISFKDLDNRKVEYFAEMPTYFNDFINQLK